MNAHARRRASAIAALGLGLAVALAGCGIAAPSQLPAVSPSPLPQASLSGSIELTRGLVEAALKASGFGLIRPPVPFRPPESPALIEIPRAVFQVVLGQDPNGGFLVIYEFPDAPSAHAAGLAQARWLASGPGAIQFALDEQHVVRQVGTTLVTFSWSPASAPDPRTGEIAAVLQTVGQGIPVQR
ncbi:MAG: hypothetical protein ACOYXS_03425 [Chloroflexota bacterium]